MQLPNVHTRTHSSHSSTLLHFLILSTVVILPLVANQILHSHPHTPVGYISSALCVQSILFCTMSSIQACLMC